MSPLCGEADQPAAAFFRRQPSRPNPARPVAKSGSAAGSGTALRVAVNVALPAELKANAPAEVGNEIPVAIKDEPVIGPMEVERA